jgi:hypothetical protein
MSQQRKQAGKLADRCRSPRQLEPAEAAAIRDGRKVVAPAPDQPLWAPIRNRPNQEAGPRSDRARPQGPRE